MPVASHQSQTPVGGESGDFEHGVDIYAVTTLRGSQAANG